jgi:hypothetical protein
VVLDGVKDFSIFAKRRRPLAAMVAAELSAGRGGYRGALKSLKIEFIKTDIWWYNRSNTPRHDPI